MVKTRSSDSSLVMIVVTCPDMKTANRIASSLTRKKLAACINISSDVKSTYRWRGKIEKAPEKLLIIKSRRQLLNKIIQDVRVNHPYQIPEIIAVPIVGGSKEYLQWLTKETSQKREGNLQFGD